VTDANVLLGRLNPKALLGGEMPIYRDLAEEALAPVAARLGLSNDRTAAGVIQIVVSAMVRAVRVISVEKGEDPRDFALVAFGGAGALHASAVAGQLGITRVLIPTAPGLLCSMGALLASPTMEYCRTRMLGADEAAEITRILAGLEGQAREWLAHEGVPEEFRRLRYSVDMRYVGQNHELRVPLPAGRISRNELDQASLDFHAEHAKQFGYSSPDHSVQVISCRVVATAVGARMDALPLDARGDKVVPRDARPVYFETGANWLETPVYWRGDLSCGATIEGPAIIEQFDSTTVMYPDDVAAIDQYGNILIAVGSASEEAQQHA
jgi:N-methylhydantoinase A